MGRTPRERRDPVYHRGIFIPQSRFKSGVTKPHLQFSRFIKRMASRAARGLEVDPTRYPKYIKEAIASGVIKDPKFYPEQEIHSESRVVSADPSLNVGSSTLWNHPERGVNSSTFPPQLQVPSSGIIQPLCSFPTTSTIKTSTSMGGQTPWEYQPTCQWPESSGDSPLRFDAACQRHEPQPPIVAPPSSPSSPLSSLQDSFSSIFKDESSEKPKTQAPPSGEAQQEVNSTVCKENDAPPGSRLYGYIEAISSASSALRDALGRLTYGPGFSVPWKETEALHHSPQSFLDAHFDRHRRLFYSRVSAPVMRIQDRAGGIFDALPTDVRIKIIQQLPEESIVSLALTSREYLYGVFGGLNMIRQLRQINWRITLKRDYEMLLNLIDTPGHDFSETPENFHGDRPMDAALYQIFFNLFLQQHEVNLRTTGRKFQVGKLSIKDQMEEIWETVTVDRPEFIRYGIARLIENKYLDRDQGFSLMKFLGGWDSLAWE